MMGCRSLPYHKRRKTALSTRIFRNISHVSIGKEEAFMFVANCMTKNPVTITPDAGIDDAAKLMDKG
ncbi:MAG: CBS domain-containing protein, partial [Selenomonas massiliensis]